MVLSSWLTGFIEVSSVPVDFLKVWLAIPHFCSAFLFENQIHGLYHKEWSLASGQRCGMAQIHPAVVLGGFGLGLAGWPAFGSLLGTTHGAVNP